METAGTILLTLALLAVLTVLVLGVVSMVRGGEYNRKHGNRLMWLRVSIQGVALLLLGLLFFVD